MVQEKPKEESALVSVQVWAEAQQKVSLQKIYANIFGEKIAKSQQLSNWEADSLTQAQQLYAATDAWACIRIHEEVKRLISTHDYQLLSTESPQCP